MDGAKPSYTTSHQPLMELLRSLRLRGTRAGNLYGTTYAGGNGMGTVYELSQNGKGSLML